MAKRGSDLRGVVRVLFVGRERLDCKETWVMTDQELQKVQDLKRRMRVLAYEMIEVEESLCSLHTRAGEGRWFLWFNAAENSLREERRSREENRRLESHKSSMQLLADATRRNGEDPQEKYPHWEWVDGKPTGRQRDGGGCWGVV